MMFTDAVEVKGARITRDGYLVADAYVGRANNIQVYKASELGLTDRDPNAQVKIFRPEAEVFSRRALDGLAHRPVTINHPPEDVTAANWKLYSVGDIGDEVMRDGDRIRVPIKVMDAGGVNAIRTTHQQFSLGYDAVVVMQAGVHDSEAFDGFVKDFEYNHLAGVPGARGGAGLRIVDERTPEPGDRVMPLKIIFVDGLPVETTDAGEMAVNKLQGVIKDHVGVIGVRDAKIVDLEKLVSTRDGEIVALKKAVEDAALTPERLDAAVLARTAVIDTAKKVLGKDFTGKGLTDAAIRKEAVKKQLGDAMPADMNDEAISGAFAVLEAAKVKAADAVATVVLDGVLPGNGGGIEAATETAMNARDAMIAGLNGAAPEGNA